MQLNGLDPRPIYTQLVERFRQQITAGVLEEGSQLPSVRLLASQLAVNPNTIQRAYRELEAQGWVQSIPGKGSFVRNPAGAGFARKHELLEQLESILTELRALGVTEQELNKYLQEEEHHV